MWRAAVCLTVLLLAVAFLFVSGASESPTAVERLGSRRDPPVQCCKQEEEAVARQAQTAVDLADLTSAEEQGQKFESHRSKKRKINDDDDDDDDDDGDDDNDDDGRRDDDDDDDDGDDNDDGHDHNGGSDTDHDSDSASAHGSHSDHDPNNHHDHNSKSGKKKRSAPWRKGVQGGNR